MLHKDWPGLQSQDFLEVAEMLRRRHRRLSEQAMAANLMDDASQHELLFTIFSDLTADLAAEVRDLSDSAGGKIDAVLEHRLAGSELRADLDYMVRQIHYNQALWFRMQE